MFLKLLEFVGIAIFVVLFFTQVILPLYQSKKLFPLFRQRQLNNELETVNSTADDVHLSNVISEQRERNEQAAGGKSTGNVQKQ